MIISWFKWVIVYSKMCQNSICILHFLHDDKRFDKKCVWCRWHLRQTRPDTRPISCGLQVGRGNKDRDSILMGSKVGWAGVIRSGAVSWWAGAVIPNFAKSHNAIYSDIDIDSQEWYLSSQKWEGWFLFPGMIYSITKDSQESGMSQTYQLISLSGQFSTFKDHLTDY